MAESVSGRRRPWAASLCFICCRGDDEPQGKLRRPKERTLRTVTAPADGSVEDDQRQGVRRGEDAAGKVSLLRTFCCFLPPPRTPRRKGSRAQQKQQQERMPLPSPGPRNGHDDPPAEAPPARRAELRVVAPTTAAEIGVAAATTPRDADKGGSSGETLPVAPPAGGSTEAAYFQREFGPVAGLSVVAAASMAGLLGGRLFAVVACVCAWFFALWIRRRRRRLAAGTGSN